MVIKSFQLAKCLLARFCEKSKKSTTLLSNDNEGRTRTFNAFAMSAEARQSVKKTKEYLQQG